MMKWLVCLATLVCSLSASLPAHAMDCVTAANATPASECVVLEQNGVRGVWFELKIADELRKAKLSFPELQLQIGALEQRGAVRDWQLERYLEVISLKQEALSEMDKGLAAQVRIAREARDGERKAVERLHAWYNQPSLWFGAGVVVTLVAGVLIVGYAN